MNRKEQADALRQEWQDDSRWANVRRNYSAEDVVRLRGSIQPEYTLARRGAEKLWSLINGSSKKGYVNCLGALTTEVRLCNKQRPDLKRFIYLAGKWAADGNTSETMYPDQFAVRL